ncbi:MAG: GTP 3',8-cyclase MoaA [Methanotrichaceae archaeon]|nr:GTP 3',8-cyclase MoaA [Methanotrichaceae archaeon]MDD1758949.1 GTP 3',8-cyclase MoaA [Methanotrichaceae archaeon]
MVETPLVDPFGRRVTGLRIALTSRCNLRCIYCHHEGESSSSEKIEAQMVISVAKAASELGMSHIKFTGGEPLMRDDLEDIISQMPRILDISVTTNGILLAQRASALADAGLGRANISLDSLNPKTYQAITGSLDGDLEQVLVGVDAATEAGLMPIKLNVVVLRANDKEIPDLIEFARSKGLILQLIQLLDLKGLGISGDIEGIERFLQANANKVVTREMHRRRKYFIDGAEVEVVRPMDNTEFCAHCTRIRLTSDGKIKPCLLRNDNLIQIGTCDKDEIKKLLRIANERREPYFKGRKPHIGLV